MKFKLLTLLGTVFSLLSCTTANTPGGHNEKWRSLFDGKTLSGWKVVHGDHPFTVENGEIVGRTLAGIATRYLTTEQEFGDFILELEMNNAQGANSGVQFRSVTTASFYAGLTGYQLEVDPSPRNWTGGIYFEGVGEWRHPPLNNQACLSAWNKNDWNTLRIEAAQFHMRTFVNGVACADLYDQYLTKGHIGLQIHSVGNDPSQSGLPTRWRNIRIIDNPTLNDYSPINLTADSTSHLIDNLSENERANNWQLAKHRHSNANVLWQRQNLTNPIDDSKWSVDVLKVDNSKQVEIIELGHQTNNYHVIGNFHMAAGTQGEIFYPVHWTDGNGKAQQCLGSYRIFDDRNAKQDNKQHGKMADLTHHLSATNLSEPTRSKRVLYDNSWRWFEIKANDSIIEHWLNSVKVVEYQGCYKTNSENLNPTAITIRLEQGQLTFRNVKYQLRESEPKR